MHKSAEQLKIQFRIVFHTRIIMILEYRMIPRMPPLLQSPPQHCRNLLIHTKNAKRYKDAANQIVYSLSRMYTSRKGDIYAFILEPITYHYFAKADMDVPINYADYYYLDSLIGSR